MRFNQILFFRFSGHNIKSVYCEVGGNLRIVEEVGNLNY